MTSPWNKALHIKTWMIATKSNIPFKDRLCPFCLWSLRGSLPLCCRKPRKWSQFGSCPASSCYKLRALYFLRLYMCYLQEFASKLLTHTTHIVHITLHPSHTVHVLYMRCIHLIHAYRTAHPRREQIQDFKSGFFFKGILYLSALISLKCTNSVFNSRVTVNRLVIFD